MALARLEIVKIGDPILRQAAEPVDRVTKALHRLIADMIQTMHEADGAGLAAPQVGVSKRIIVVDVGNGTHVLINPRIVHAEGTDVDVEGCLSIPGKRGYVERAARVRVEGLREDGKPIRLEGEGMLARALQHEIDHLEGILFIDKATGVYDLDDESELEDVN